MNNHSVLEEALIHTFESRTDNEGISTPFLDDLKNGQFLRIVHSSQCEEIFKTVEQPAHFSFDNPFSESLQRIVDCYADQRCKDIEPQLELLCIGIASLQGFLQSNWTGPPLTDDSFALPWLRSYFGDCQVTDKEIRDRVTSCLVLDGESCWVMKHQELLLLARVILQTCAEKFTHIPTCQWWLMRCLFIQQQVLDEHSPTIHNALVALINELGSSENLLRNVDNKILFNLEAARILLYYGQVIQSKVNIYVAIKAAEMKVELVGALGKRTRYQQLEVAQMSLHVTLDRDANSETETDRIPVDELPKDVSLEDEVRLNQIQFANDSEGSYPTLRPIEQAVILGLFIQTQKSQPKDKLADEEVMPYLTCLLSQPRSWNLHMSALLLRCHIESNHRRTVERSMQQAQALVDAINAEVPTPTQRMRYLYCSHLPHRWAVEAELATLLISIGAFNGALDIYLRLELWEEVIVCYNLLKLRHKAAEIIQQELSKGETVKLWCLLGDATDDPGCYEKAWELSGHKSGRAQRHWGIYFFYKKMYAECIPHLQLSLSINSIQQSIWFMLGFACMEQENWTLCAQAYRRYCEIDTDSFEAWNNLAKAYVKLGEKARAWKTLQEALKCNYENWQVWDNLMAVSTDCGEFEEVIRSYHRLLDLKGKHADEEVLRILVTAIVGNLPDNQGVPAGRLKKNALALFGRLTGQVTGNATLWQLYAQLTASVELQTPETLERTAQYLQRAHRSAVQNARWETDVQSCHDVMKLCASLADAYLACCKKCPLPSQQMKLLTSAKFSLQGVVTKVKSEYFRMDLDEVNELVVTHLQELERKLEEIVQEVQQLQSRLLTLTAT